MRKITKNPIMKINVLIVTMLLMLISIACTSDEEISENVLKDSTNVEAAPSDDENGSENEADVSAADLLYIAGHEIAREAVLRTIPETYLQKAREELVVSYQHTSHGTHVSYGMYGLPEYKDGDDVLFGISTNGSSEGDLTFYDNKLEAYSPDGVNAPDLSSNETAFIETTRAYLDDADNAEVNVIMWAWCDIAGHNVEENYLPGMAQLISEYGEGGSKIGSGANQRAKPVHFIFMTGHANEGNNAGEGEPKELAELINDYCVENQYFCLDYYSIDTHDMDFNYYEDAGDNGQSSEYGGNFYKDWQGSHELGVDYWENRVAPSGSVIYGDHTDQHITSNRKAMAMWWILARIAGWDGDGLVSSTKH